MGFGLRSEKMTTNKRSGVKLSQNNEKNVQYIKKQAKIVWGLQSLHLWWEIWWEICLFFSFHSTFLHYQWGNGSRVFRQIIKGSNSLFGWDSLSSKSQNLGSFDGCEQTIRHTQQDEFWTIKMRRFKLPESDLHCDSNIGENTTAITWTMQGWNSASCPLQLFQAAMTQVLKWSSSDLGIHDWISSIHALGKDLVVLLQFTRRALQSISQYILLTMLQRNYSFFLPLSYSMHIYIVQISNISFNEMMYVSRKSLWSKDNQQRLSSLRTPTPALWQLLTGSGTVESGWGLVSQARLHCL